MRRLRVGLAQINCTVGDLPGNARKMAELLEEARALGVQLLAFPEMTIPGYPPEDLLLNPSFIRDNLKVLDRFCPLTKGMTVIVGYIDRKDDIFNAAAILHDGVKAGVYHKIFLPNYGVFDEERYFEVGRHYPVFRLHQVVFGVNICEDIWYPDGPTVIQTFGGGAEVIVNISASPYHAGKAHIREEMLATRAKDSTAAVLYVNMVGGQDELVFDGQSLMMDGDGEIVARGPAFSESLLVADLSLEAVFRARLHDPRRRNRTLQYGKQPGIEMITLPPIRRSARPARRKPAVKPVVTPLLPHLEEIYRALVLGVRDYVGKNGFHQAVIGLSGGVDSALTAAIAVDALGQSNVVGVMMPSMYTSAESQQDAAELASRLGIRFMTIPITELYAAYLKQLSPAFGGRQNDSTEENLQARIRGTYLMALSNKLGWLVLTTGNKSEFSVGYTTLYGDMAGGFAVLKDVPKTLVYQLASYRNKTGSNRRNTMGNKQGSKKSRKGQENRPPGPLIPRRILDRPPTAELRPGQTDQDNLPPYEILDPILQAYVEEDQSPEEIVAGGAEAATVNRVIGMVIRSEYKRRQAPPGIKITPRALGKDRRMPITNWYKPMEKKG
jgi:NAD+ synthase (glutamine-hydrolysing)